MLFRVLEAVSGVSGCSGSSCCLKCEELFEGWVLFRGVGVVQEVRGCLEG